MPDDLPAVAIGDLPEAPTVQVLADLCGLVDEPSVRPGARWRLAESGRQLDANLIHLPAGQRVDTHTEPDLDVLLVVVAGGGVVGGTDGDRTVVNGNVVWLPRGSTRNLTAGDEGLSYLTVHRRRPGLQITKRSGQ